MIPDWDTNHLFVSDRLELEFPALMADLRSALSETPISDDLGHSDGLVRFVAENHVLINDYSTVDSTFGAKLRTLLEKNGLDVEVLPMFEEDGGQRRGDLPSAVGLYINYLRVGGVVVVPGYDRPEDQDVVEKLRQVMPDASVFQVPCRSLAEKSGVLNCASRG